jgi:tetratricopeptide (TPR) repeat protein
MAKDPIQKNAMQPEQLILEAEKLSFDSDQAKGLGNINEAIRFQDLAVSSLSKCIRPESEPKDLRIMAVALAKIGMLRLETKQYDRARKDLQSSLEIRRNLFKKLNTDNSARDVCYGLNCLGVLERSIPDHAQAKVYFIEQVNLARFIATEFESIENLRDLSLAYLRLGDSEDAQGNHLNALENYHLCFETDKKILDMEPAHRSMQDMALSATRLAHILVKLKSIDQAENYFDIARGLAANIFKGEITVLNARNYVKALTEYYDFQAIGHNSAKMLQALQERSEVEFFIFNQTQDPEALHHYSISMAQSGDTFYALGNHAKALVFYNKFAEIAEANHQYMGNDATLAHWALALQKLGATRIDLGEYDQARNLLINSLEFYTKIADSNGFNLASQHPLSIAYQWMAILEQACGNKELAIQYITMDIEIVRRLVLHYGPSVFGKELASSLSRLGQFHQDNDEIAEALECYRETHELNRQAFVEHFNAQNMSDLTASKIKIAETTTGAERQDFIRTAIEGIQLLEKHYPHHPKVEILRRQVVGFEK